MRRKRGYLRVPIGLRSSWAFEYFERSNSGDRLMLDERRRLWVRADYSGEAGEQRLLSARPAGNRKKKLLVAIALLLSAVAGWVAVPIAAPGTTSMPHTAPAHLASMSNQTQAKFCPVAVQSLKYKDVNSLAWQSLGGLDFASVVLNCAQEKPTVEVLADHQTKRIISLSVRK